MSEGGGVRRMSVTIRLLDVALIAIAVALWVFVLFGTNLIS
jgi:hypothetical protein